MNTIYDIAAGWCPERLSALREAVRIQGLDGFIVPRWDHQQFEYVTLANERLAWLTGFTGSWGLAIVTHETVILFVDGRYTEQAGNQTEGNLIKIQHLYDAPPETWLAKHAQQGWQIGYDSEILTPDLFQRFQPVCQENGAACVPAQTDPFIIAWQDRPAKTSSPALPQSVAWAGEAHAGKLARTREKMQALGIDWLVETQPDNVNWLLNLRGCDLEYCPVICARMLLSQSGPVHVFVAADQLAALQASPHWADGPKVSIHASDRFLAIMHDQVKSGQRLLTDPVQGPQGACDVAKHQGATFLLARSPITDLKAIKNEVELAALRSAAQADSLIWIHLLHWLEQSVADGAIVTELSVEQELHRLRSEIDDYTGPSFRTISAVGGNASLAHYAAPETGGAKIEGQTIYLLDCGAQFNRGGTTDTTRTWCFEPAPDAVRKSATIVLKGHIALVTQMFPSGTFGHALDAAARMPLWMHGLDYDHGTGHGVGHYLSVHEFPQRLQKAGTPVGLKAGMTLTNEPGFYRPGEFGIRHENLCEVVEEETGWLSLEPLAFVPFNRRLIDIDLLTKKEQCWLNQYHKEIFTRLGPLIECGETKTWLREQTLALGSEF